MANATSHNFKATRPRRSPTRSLQQALLNVKRGFVSEARGGRRRSCPNSRRCARKRRAIKDHTLAHLDLYLEPYERKVIASGGKVHCAPRRRRGAGHRARALRAAGAKLVTKGKSMVARGDRAQRRISRPNGIDAGRDRSRRIYRAAAATSRRAISSRPAIHLNKETGRSTTFAASTATCRATAGSTEPESGGRGARACCGRISSPPMSASPAPIFYRRDRLDDHRHQ